MITCFIIFILTTQLSHQEYPFEVVSTTESPGSSSLIANLSNIISKNNHLLEQIQKQIFRGDEVPKNCLDVQQRNHNGSNLYQIQPKFARVSFQVYCDMDTWGGGWTYIIKRYNGLQEFYLGWEDYKQGFGNLLGEFWLGLQKIHLLTGYEYNEALVELTDWDLKKAYAHYEVFGIGNEKEGYAMKYLKWLSGDAGDSLSAQADSKFTTKDRDQDVWQEGNCAEFSQAGWWFSSCKSAQLTGKYLSRDKGGGHYTGILWTSFRGGDYSLKEVKMMVRPKKFS